MTVSEAASALGITVDAVRKRIQRGTLASEKASDGRVYVLLDLDQDTDTPRSEYEAMKDELVEVLRDRVRRLEHDLDVRTEEIRRRDHIIAALTDRIPELEAPSSSPEQPDATESADEGPGRGRPPQDTETASQRPWWRRWLGG